jgi:hypothetical protein
MLDIALDHPTQGERGLGGPGAGFCLDRVVYAFAADYPVLKITEQILE